jgi:predicted enzyme related to lactoylglutathione lyase
MSRIESYAPGSFCWAELATGDTAAAKQFYAEMFGWTSVDMPTGRALCGTIGTLWYSGACKRL